MYTVCSPLSVGLESILIQTMILKLINPMLILALGLGDLQHCCHILDMMTLAKVEGRRDSEADETTADMTSGLIYGLSMLQITKKKINPFTLFWRGSVMNPLSHSVSVILLF